MKLDKHLTITGKAYPLISDNLTLELKGYARGEYLIKTDNGDPDLSGLIEYQHGYSDDQLYSVFKGIANIGQAAGNNQFRIIAKSLSSVLDLPGRFSLRHITAIDLLEKVSELTGLEFIYPTGADYMSKRIPNFYNMDTCRGAIECFAAWGIERGIWTQLPDGKIFWGSWDDSPFADKDPVPIDSMLITMQNPADRSFQIPVISALVPGMRVQNNLMIEQLEIFGNNMRVRWLKFSET
jgi:hypothetical protein